MCKCSGGLLWSSGFTIRQEKKHFPPLHIASHSIIPEEIPQLSLQEQRISMDVRVEQSFVPVSEVGVTSR